MDDDLGTHARLHAEPFIASTLDTVLSQDAPLEIVACDDGSTDRTSEILARYAQVDPRIRILSHINSGASASRNAALRQARGEHVLFMDADDLLAPGSLQQMYALATSHPHDVICSPWAKFTTDPNDLHYGPFHSAQPMPGWQWVTTSFLHDDPTYPGRFLLPRELAGATDGWDTRLRFQDDMEYFSRVISRAPLVWPCPGALFCYRQGVPGSISNTFDSASSTSHLLATCLAADHLLKVKDTRETRRAAVRQLMLVAHTQLLAASDVSAKAEAKARAISTA